MASLLTALLSIFRRKSIRILVAIGFGIIVTFAIARELDRTYRLQRLVEVFLGHERFVKTVPGPFRVIAEGQTKHTAYIEIEFDPDRVGCLAKPYDGGAKAIETKDSVEIVLPLSVYSPRFRASCLRVGTARLYHDLVALQAPLGSRRLKGNCIPLGMPCQVTRAPHLPP